MNMSIKLLVVIFSFLGGISFSYASGGTTGGSSSGGGDTVTVKVTEKIPGAGCGEKDKKTGLYTCTVQPGFKTIQIMIGQIVKWFTAVAALSGVLFIVVNGILLSMDPDNKEKAKGRIKQTLAGLILLLLSGVILSIIAPWVYK